MTFTVDQSNWIEGTRYFTIVTPDNHSGWLYIVTLLSICYIFITFVIRFVVKYGMYGQDDWALLASTLLALGASIALLTGIPYGLGESVKLLLERQKLTYTVASDIERLTSAHVFLFFLSHGTSKLSSALLTQRLFQNGFKRNIYLCWSLIGLSGFYGLFSILTMAVGCQSPGFPFPGQTCNNRHLRWQLITAVDVATEILLIVIPTLLIMNVQIKRNAKILVVAVFAVRGPDIIFSFLNLFSAVARDDARGDIGLDVVKPIIWIQTEILWSIVAASVPCLKTFMRPFDNIDEETWRSGQDMYNSNKSWRDPRDGAVPLEEIRGHKKGMVLATGKHNLGGSPLNVRPDRVGHDVTIGHSGMDAMSDDEMGRRSWGSQERIIKAHTQWEVSTESAGRDPYVIE